MIKQEFDYFSKPLTAKKEYTRHGNLTGPDNAPVFNNLLTNLCINPGTYKVTLSTRKKRQVMIIVRDIFSIKYQCKFNSIFFGKCLKHQINNQNHKLFKTTYHKKWSLQYIKKSNQKISSFLLTLPTIWIRYRFWHFTRSE